MISISNEKLFVQLATAFDFERFEQMSKNQKIEELNKPCGNIFFEVNSINEAVSLCSRFIDNNNLGASNWCGGLIVNENFKFIATVSYNGKVWDNEDWKKAKEIKL
jgi:hypothetical protein